MGETPALEGQGTLNTKYKFKGSDETILLFKEDYTDTTVGKW